MDPGADRRKEAVENVPAGVKLQNWAAWSLSVVHIERITEDVVDAAAHLRPPVADLDAALAGAF